MRKAIKLDRNKLHYEMLSSNPTLSYPMKDYKSFRKMAEKGYPESKENKAKDPEFSQEKTLIKLRPVSGMTRDQQSPREFSKSFCSSWRNSIL